MKRHELPFVKILILRDDIAEVMFDEGVELTLTMIEQYHAFLAANLTAPYALLVNKVNSYTYDFEAQMKLGTQKQLNVAAVVVYDRMTRVATETVISYPRSHEWNIKVFSNRDEALNWLIHCQQPYVEELAS